MFMFSCFQFQIWNVICVYCINRTESYPQEIENKGLVYEVEAVTAMIFLQEQDKVVTQKT